MALASRAEEPARPTRWPLVAGTLAMIAFLTFGWLLIGRALPDAQPVTAGTRLAFGSDDEAVTVVGAPGWELSRSASVVGQTYQLTRGDVELTMAYTSLPAGDIDVWSGLSKVVRVAGGTLGPAQPATTAGGVAGQTGSLHQSGETGVATVFVAPAGDYAIESTVLGKPGASPADRAAATEIVRSLTFESPR